MCVHKPTSFLANRSPKNAEQILFRGPLEQHLAFVNRKKGFHTSCLPKNGRIKVVFCIKRHKNFELQVQNLKNLNIGISQEDKISNFAMVPL